MITIVKSHKPTIWQERIDRNIALYEKLDSGKAYQGGESIFPDFGRIGRTGLENAKEGVVSHYKTADFARTMFGSLPAENSERLTLAIKADADTVQYGATPPSKYICVVVQIRSASAV